MGISLVTICPASLGKAIALTLIALSCAAAYWLRTVARNVTVANGGLVVPEDQLNIGEVWEDPAFESTIGIKNPTDHDIEIEGFASSCNCSSIEPSSVLVPSGQSVRVGLTINLSLTSPRMADVNSWDFTVTLFPRITDASVEQGAWALRGRVKRLLTISPREVQYGATLIQGAPSPARSLLVRTSIPLNALGATCPSSSAVVTAVRSRRNPEAFDVVIVPNSGLPLGPFRFDVMLDPVSTEGTRLPSVRVPVEGVVVTEIQASPQALVFGAKPVGTIVTETILLHSITGTEFVIHGVQPSSVDITVEPSPASAGSGKAFRITQKVSKPGKQEGTVAFLVETKDRKASTVHARCVYIGIPGD